MSSEQEVESDADGGSSLLESPVSGVQSVAFQPTFTQPATRLAGARNGKAKRTVMDDQLYTFMVNIAASNKRTSDV